jgi:hypothetical protein
MEKCRPEAEMAKAKGLDDNEDQRAPKREWRPAGEGYPGVYVSSLSPLQAVTPEQRQASLQEFRRKYHAAARALAGVDDD